MPFLLRRRAVLHVLLVSLLIPAIGCTTRAPFREVDAAANAGREPSVREGRAPEPDSATPPEERERQEHDGAPTLPGNAAVFLTAGLTQDLEPVIIGDEVAAGWYFPPAEHGANTDEAPEVDSTGDQTDEWETTPGAMGLYASAESLVLAYRSASVAATGRPGATKTTQLLSDSESYRVRAFDPVELHIQAGQPNGFRIRFSRQNREEEIFVIWTSLADRPPYTVRLPVSAVRRTALRDLTDDNQREMVHLSVVFDAGGNREIIVDALRWDATRFVHSGSVALIQAVNQELAHLEARLTTDTDPRWVAAATRALEPLEEAPPVGPLLPSQHVRVPQITELSVDLGRGAWRFSHDIAVDGNIYRLRIQLEANPLVDRPAHIDGFQGL
ncbi:MAG: hypothetical protein ACOCYB_02715 [Alkalispirochaeta sp.]